jgi:hypothetical protein
VARVALRLLLVAGRRRALVVDFARRAVEVRARELLAPLPGLTRFCACSKSRCSALPRRPLWRFAFVTTERRSL